MRSLLRVARQSIRQTLRARQLHQQIRSASELRLIIGASGTAQEGWIATEQQLIDLLQASTWSNFIMPGSVDAILAEHVWEHLTESQGRLAAQTCFQFLKPGGHLRVAVPDGFNPSSAYLQRVRPGGTGAGADDHKVLYNHQTLCDVLGSAGFETRLIEYFDADGEFHAADWEISDGFVLRTLKFDRRNEQEPFGYTSLFLDAIRPALRQVA